MIRRMWTIHISGRPPTINAERKGARYWTTTRQLTRQWRETARNTWLAHTVDNDYPGRLEQITVTAHQTCRDGRWHQDLGACMPAVKAVIDGLVDTGLIPDDTPRHVTALTFLPPAITGVDGLEIIIHTTEENTP